MLRLAFAASFALASSEASAMVRYMVQDMTCAQVQQALERDGVAIAEHFHKRRLPERIGRLVRTRQVRVGDHCLSFYRQDQQPQ